MVWPAVLAAVGAVAGNAMQSRTDRANRISQQNANDLNYERQKEFAQMGIRWRVDDAKAAGLHPLYALSGGGASYSPSPYSLMSTTDYASMGQNVGRAIGGLSAEAREAQALSLEAAKAGIAKDYAQAAAYDAEAARTRQMFLNQKPTITMGEPEEIVHTRYWQPDAQGVAAPGEGSGRFEGRAVERQPPAYLTSNKASAGFTKFNVPGVGELILPSASSLSEALESLENPVLQMAVAAANYAHYKDTSKLRKLFRSRGWSDPFGALNDFSMGR